jgi:hypothetical protein
VVNTLALCNHIGHQTQGNVTLLCAGVWVRGLLPRALVAYLTALQAQLAFQYPDHFFDP